MVSCQLSAMGMVNALGNTHHEILTQLLAENRKPLSESSVLNNHKSTIIAKVKDTLPEIPHSLRKYNCRNNALALAAYIQIEKQVKETIEKVGASRIGVVAGTSTSGIASTETAMAQYKTDGEFPEDYNYAQHEMNGLAEFIASYAGITGPAYTISTACTSSAKVFASGRALLEMGICDAVLVGGADSLCEFTLNGFASLEVLSQQICNPMSKNRKGLNIGEGASLFLMEAHSEGIQLWGVGESSDAYHMSSPDPEGQGAIAAIRSSLADAHLPSEAIHYINLHGTATQLNDRMESLAIQSIFNPPPPCSSTKPLVGHCLGTAGAIELGLCWLILAYGEKRVHLPPHWWDQEPDENLPALPLVQLGQTIPARGNVALLSCSFAFGGNNCSLIISKNFD